MGPITLFDKSFLQSLSLDETVWFDHFFLTNVAPIFYIETLADLSKPKLKERTPDEEVSIIAEKFPDMHGMPCAYHTELCISNLLGRKVPMTGQIPLSQGFVVKHAGKIGAVSQQSSEYEAFSRWRKGEFQEVERLYAHYWRQALYNIDLTGISGVFRTLGLDTRSCHNLEDARDLAMATVKISDRQSGIMALALRLLDVPQHLHNDVRNCWRKAGYPSVHEYAPYAAFVLTVELFFHIALGANLISSERASNRVDIAYLFYLPFCMMFVSNDRLHKTCVPLFLRNDQEFVWGQDLKKSLNKINEYYLQLQESVNEKGVLSLSIDLPSIGDNLIDHLCSWLLPKYQKRKEVNAANSSPTNSPTLEEIKGMEKALPLSPEELVDFDPNNIEAVLVKRSTRRIKGSWRLVSD